eukprot:TRINITY_DN5166_c0_g2_i1.p1 TRINITY_DN5166_c0_g2~~TRINITY_DN5166_c0_g2_i1.p1  ORF type:complete len:100 (-),score=7.36 TRINITY_DN5166_c0_g2_i1:229-528(-)
MPTSAAVPASSPSLSSLPLHCTFCISSSPRSSTALFSRAYLCLCSIAAHVGMHNNKQTKCMNELTLAAMLHCVPLLHFLFFFACDHSMGNAPSPRHAPK